MILRYERTFSRVCGILGPCRRAPLGKVFRDFAKASRRTYEVVRFTSFVVKVGNIIAFGGSALPRILGGVPLRHVILRASSPCLAPIPGQNGEGRDTCIGSALMGITKVCKGSPRGITRIASSGALGIFKVLGWTL